MKTDRMATVISTTAVPACTSLRLGQETFADSARTSLM